MSLVKTLVNPFKWSRMRLFTGALLGLALLVGVPLIAATAAELLPRYRVKRLSDALSQPSPGYRPLTDLLDPTSPTVPDLDDAIGDNFDPGQFDEIAVAGRGRTMAFTALNTTLQREIALVHEGRAGAADGSERISVDAGQHERPSIQFDRLGRRLVVRAENTDGTQANIYLHSVKRNSEADARVQNITALPRTREVQVLRLDDDGNPDLDMDGNEQFDTVIETVTGDVYDPVFAALTRTVKIDGGIKLVGRDARVAFVSTADLDHGGRSNVFGEGTGKNPLGLPQLFLWSESDGRFRQLTEVFGAEAQLNRPTMNGRATLIAFECSDDLLPEAANPLDPTQLGNPDGVRQIYLWRKGLGIQQLTWSDRDCFAPRMDRLGRVVYFSSQGDLIAGGNPEGNHEIFRWTRGGNPVRRLRQMTATEAGDNVLPRATDRAGDFVFYSTARKPEKRVPATDDDPEIPAVEFGEAPAETTAKAFSWRRGKIRLIHGQTDDENETGLFFYGPPAPGRTLSKVHLGTNDPWPQAPSGAGLPTTFFLIRATRFGRR